MTNINHSLLLDCENRRIAPRLRRSVLVEILGANGESFETHTINISQTGLRLVSNQPISNGETLALELNLDSGKPLNFSGRAVWQKPIGSMGVHVIGLSFEPNQQLSTPHLQKWLRQYGAAA